MKTKHENIHTYSWKGLNDLGHLIKGTSIAASFKNLQTELRLRNVKLIKARKKLPSLLRLNKTIKAKEIVLFSQYLSDLIAAKIPLVRALEIIAQGHTNFYFKTILSKIKDNISAGNLLHVSLSLHPDYFNPLFINLIAAGEKSGTLESMLKILTLYLQKIATLKNRIIKMMYYPLFVSITATIVTTALLVFIVPQFENLFKSFEAELPWFTQSIILLSRTMAHNGTLIFLAVAVCIAGLVFLSHHSPKFNRCVDLWSLKIPIFGKIVQKAIITRTMITLATTLSAGMPLIECLEITAAVANNHYFKCAFLALRSGVTSGHSLYSLFNAQKIFPTMVGQMILVGEESGNIQDILKRIAFLYEEDLETSLNAMTALAEPLIMLFLALIIGSFVLALYLPIFRLGTIV
ncbi:MAG: type II secretion system F family protein [Gammaproteobacteria bacterium]|nr:type II secretion system F family protein [Gammaproteobacteria bacterium]